jgi:serine/threonine protein kinase
VDQEQLAQYVAALGSPDPPDGIGALKVFEISPDAEGEKATRRLAEELRALSTLHHPAILKYLIGNSRKGFLITEYHPSGTLDKHLGRYKGKVLEALEAFRPLVEGVAAIHGLGAIHRDIKPENIFIAADGRLVLGDFGIVIFKDSGHRLTTTYEKVGTTFWMAPWAYKQGRLDLEEVTVSLDIFPLTKVLWSMISGRNGFIFSEYDRAENNLEKLFSSDPAMRFVNQLLGKCVVRDEKDCKLSAKELLAAVDGLIHQIRSAGRKPEQGPWPCSMCGKGYYSEIGYISPSVYKNMSGNRAQFTVYVCDHCGHAETFMIKR